jgi:hypothetical protein
MLFNAAAYLTSIFRYKETCIQLALKANDIALKIPCAHESLYSFLTGITPVACEQPVNNAPLATPSATLQVAAATLVSQSH